MSLIPELRKYYGLFGGYGAWLAGRSLLFNVAFEAAVQVPGLRCPVHIRLLSSDVVVLQQVFLDKEYSWELPAEPRIIIDAGANIGITSVFFASQYPEARIIALEPEGRNYELLRKNIGPYPNIIAVRAALWRESGSINVVDPAEGNWGFRTQDKTALIVHPICSAVRAVTLNSLMADLGLEQVDLLKVDIEGAEKEVFASSRDWVQRVRTILIELHDRFATGCSRSVYRATEDFEYEDRKGEVICFSRANGGEGPSGQGSSAPEGHATKSGQAPRALPFKIVAAHRECPNRSEVYQPANP